MLRHLPVNLCLPLRRGVQVAAGKRSLYVQLFFSLFLSPIEAIMKIHSLGHICLYVFTPQLPKESTRKISIKITVYR